MRYDAAAKHTGIKLSTLYALVHQKRVPHYRYGPRFVLFDLDELDAWILQHRVADAEGTPAAGDLAASGSDRRGGDR